MQVIGVIAEYNPFHNGHLYHLAKARSRIGRSAVVVVMSGSFTQRGEAAVLSKWQRGEAAVRNGADLVLELPAIFAVQSAEYFARGGVDLLNKLHVVDVLACGTECDDLVLLNELAAALPQEKVQRLLREKIAAGMSYAAAAGEAVGSQVPSGAAILRQPNVILTVEYLRAIKKTGADLVPLLIKRTCGHNDDGLDPGVLSAGVNAVSAAAIRREIYRREPDFSLIQKFLPPDVWLALKNSDLPDSELLWRPLLLRLLFNERALSAYYGVNEGLEHRLQQAAKASPNLTKFLTVAVSKRVPRSRIRRIIVYLMLTLTKERAASLITGGVSYARVLAANGLGRQLLQKIKKSAVVPIVTKTSHFLSRRRFAESYDNLTPLEQMLKYDIMATELRSLIQGTPCWGSDFLTSPLMIE